MYASYVTRCECAIQKCLLYACQPNLHMIYLPRNYRHINAGAISLSCRWQKETRRRRKKKLIYKLKFYWENEIRFFMNSMVVSYTQQQKQPLFAHKLFRALISCAFNLFIFSTDCRKLVLWKWNAYWFVGVGNSENVNVIRRQLFDCCLFNHIARCDYSKCDDITNEMAFTFRWQTNRFSSQKPITYWKSSITVDVYSIACESTTYFPCICSNPTESCAGGRWIRCSISVAAHAPIDTVLFYTLKRYVCILKDIELGELEPLASFIDSPTSESIAIELCKSPYIFQ